MIKSIYELLIVNFLRIYILLPRQVKRKVVFLFIFIFTLGLVEVLSILSLSYLGMCIAVPNEIMSINYTKFILNILPFLRVFTKSPQSIALATATIVVIIMFIKNIYSAFVFMYGSKVGEDISIYAGNTILYHYLNSSYLWHLSGESASMFQALGWRGMLGQMAINLLNLYAYGFISLLLFVTLVSSTPGTICITLVVVGFIVYVLYKSIKKAIDRSGKSVADSAYKENKTILNATNGIREIIIYRQQAIFFEKFSQACELGRDGRAFLNIASTIPHWVMEVVGFSIIPATMFLMIYTKNASISEMTGVLTIIMLACWRILPLFNKSLSSVVAVRSLLPMVHHVLARLEYCKNNYVEYDIDPTNNFQFNNVIELSHVSFTYPKYSTPAIHNISMRVPKSKQVGIIGFSGSGKSTIASLLCGLFAPTSGELKIDGKPLSRQELVSYRMRIGYIPQTPYIMPGTLAENVSFSQWGKHCDEERVLRACKMAALDIVFTNQHGIYIPIGEHGAGLSGGQIQRVSIARALYTDPDVLLLDEATSSLDHATEREIIKTINELSGQITVVIIAHRLSTLEHCDIIYRVENGQIIDTGPPSEILPKYEQDLNSKI